MRKMSKKKRASLGNKPVYSTISSKPKKRKSWKRKPSEFKRIYHSRERVRWIKDQPCIYCTAISPLFGIAGQSHNAHTVSGGAGYKADHTTIIPLCGSHHMRYDRHLFPFNNNDTRQTMKDAAAIVHARWLLHIGEAHQK